MTEAVNALGNEDLSLTDGAQAKFAELMEQVDDHVAGVRVFASPGGCSGVSFGMNFTDQINADEDGVLQCNGFQVIVDQGTMQYLKEAKKRGSRIVCVDPRRHRTSQQLADEEWVEEEDDVETKTMTWDEYQARLKEIKENKQIETIELHHILNYKREKIGKPAVSQLQEGNLDLPKKKETRVRKNEKTVKKKKVYSRNKEN
mgnify:CR=1 FL=1